MMKVLVSLQNTEAGEVKKILKAIDTKWVPRGKRKSGTQNKRMNTICLSHIFQNFLAIKFV